MPQAQAERLMKFTSPLGQDVLVIEALEGVEGISRLFDFQAELLADTGTTIDPAQLIGKNVTVEIALVDVQGSRYVNGIVAAFEQTSGDTDFDNYRVHIVPSLWQLTLSSNCRVFQSETVMAIIRAVFEPYGISMADKTEGSLQALDYCTQYFETDFNFISRLAEQHGIFYWFEHTESDNKVYFSNARTAYQDCELVSTITFAPNSGKGQDRYVSSLEEFSSTATMVTGKHSTQDYDYRSYQVHKADAQNSVSPFVNNAYERYTYPGGEEGYVKEVGKALSTPNHVAGFLTARTNASDAGAEIFHGSSSARSFASGYTFTMKDHPRDDWNRKYLLTQISHQVEQVPSYRSTGVGQRADYVNRFSAISSDTVFRPHYTTPKPVIYGPQTAMVVTASGEDIHLDKLGRVCVQFFWDRLRAANTVDNTWLRVAQPWAGSGWGTFFWPRVKDEVIVQFINGDPDNPIVVGSVYNGVNMPKYALPDMSTRSGLVTRSSKGGAAANANEIRFEDKKGSEQIYLNAEMDMDHRIENDHRRYVGGKDSLIVKGAQYDDITGDRHSNMQANLVEKIGQKADLDVGTDMNHKIGQNYSLKVGQNHGEKVGMNYAVDAGMEVYVKGGMTVVIESGMALTLKGAGGSITIDAMGVSITGTMVLINSGGAPVAGSPATLTDPGAPTAPDQADDGTKGGKM
ncbi:type VI secretion system Vgr family protein [Granulicella arctica]|uniref:type VI secretion system Vgr family protein n=1 Tax=Granulicella arctica TaxID=940613 RepID=UPI0021DFA37F|nr:type VI secretion system tip protein TssI/VgrG [Granulicella arctica]